MIFELIVMMTPLDGSTPGMRASKVFQTKEECVSAGQDFDQSTKATRGSDVKFEYTCEQKPDDYTGEGDNETASNAPRPNSSTQASAQNAPLWNGLNYGMTKGDAAVRLRSIQGVTSVNTVNGSFVVNTDNSFAVAGQPAKLSLLFSGNSLSRVYIISKPYCVFVSLASVSLSPPFKIASFLEKKYKIDVRIRFAGSDKDFSDGLTRVQLRSFSDNRRCGPNELQEHLTLTYLPEAEGKAQEDAIEKAAERDTKTVLDGL